MRFTAIILSLLILVYSNIPCTDNTDCERDKTEQTGDHSGHQHHEDTCTPFCVCACCGITAIVINFSFFKTRLVKEQISQTVIPYHSNFISSYCHSFWQPPKLG